MTNVFLPPANNYISRDCSKPCDTNSLDLCETECEQYTFGPFLAPASVYTYYEYEDYIDLNNISSCKNNCTTNYLKQELNYEIYQIIEGEEHFVGNWLIKDKSGPNKREFKECGEYILRYCSSPPVKCYPDCIHPKPPVFQVAKTSCCDCCLGSYIASSVGEECPSFELFYEFLLDIPKCCSITVNLTFYDDTTNSFTLPAKQVNYQFDSGKFCTPIKEICFEGANECIEKLHVIVKR